VKIHQVGVRTTKWQSCTKHKVQKAKDCTQEHAQNVTQHSEQKMCTNG